MSTYKQKLKNAWGILFLSLIGFVVLWRVMDKLFSPQAASDWM